LPILRINQQQSGAPNHYKIDVAATDIPNFAPLSFSIDITFELTRQDAERIRWYLEDFLQFDEDPAPQIAGDIERFMAECGEVLFRSIFEGSQQGTQLWMLIEPYLPTTRIEITTGIADATPTPWELIRNPSSRKFLALSTQSFVRTQREAQKALTPGVETDKVRILLVICRPKGGDDVPFRSVAGRLVTRLSDDARDAFDLDVLRPPTYEQLSNVLRLAKERGRPYHIVHFDGHGVYAEAENLAGIGKVLNNQKFTVGGRGRRGFLVFEDPESAANSKFVDGFWLGELLRDAGVSVLVLNACQSAFAEAPARPQEVTTGAIEAYSSLAQAVMDAGAAGVVAMRYSVYVVTAAQFVAELYGALARGRQLGEAVTWARKNLADHPQRRIAYEARPLQDWSVPVVWERGPLRLWPKRPDAPPIQFSLNDSAPAKPDALDQNLPARPDVGFYGCDETLYALDRAFDTHRLVLLHGYAGSGKTSTAAEFARWYALTGGVEGPVLFTSFERYLPLARVLDKIGAVFGQALEANGIHWDAIIDLAQRRDIALQVLRQVPVLWIWDHVALITDFPTGTASDWSVEQQQELRAFLSAARDTKAKFLLTSRRDEQTWLGDLPWRVPVQAMPMQERQQLAGAIVAQRGRRLADLPDLKPLLKFTHGNPLTILVTVGEALRAGIDTTEQLEAFVGALRNGVATFEDEESEGRSKSLGASLSYGVGAAFNEGERKVLALLHLFQGFVCVDALLGMGLPDAEWCLEAVRGLTREQGNELLDRAAEIGLLNAHGGGYYSIHPALPWYFRTLFEQYFLEQTGAAGSARRAFASAMGQLGNLYHNEYNEGRREVLSIVAAEEDNLLAAWRLARSQGWWREVIASMQGLETLYDATGRRAEWRRLVHDVMPDFVDPLTDRPLTGRQEAWGLLTEYRVSLAQEDRNWTEAERLQRLRVDWDRQRAEAVLAFMPIEPNASQRNLVRSLAGSLHQLAQIQRAQGSPDCAETYRKALDVACAIGDSAAQSLISLSLGNAFMNIADLRDLDEAERWYRQSLDVAAAGDELTRGRIVGQLGRVAYERFNDARDAERPPKELARYLTESARLCEQVLEITPRTAVIDRAATHNQLGNIYQNAGDTERALYHYRHGIRHSDEAGDIFGAGNSRFNIALALLAAERSSEARAYAVAALANFRTFGDHASSQIEQTERLVAVIDQHLSVQTDAR
jgi:tetratricopeptide (TPR) repeat protein